MLIQPEDFRSTFEKIKTRQEIVQIFSSPNCDSICASHILTDLIKSEDIAYNVIPVSSHEELFECYSNLKQNQDVGSLQKIGTIFMINCGGMVDLQEFLDLGDEIQVMTFDSHRPYHPNNLLHSSIFLFGTERPEDIPTFDDEDEVQGSDDDDEDDDFDDFLPLKTKGEKRKKKQSSSSGKKSAEVDTENGHPIVDSNPIARREEDEKDVSASVGSKRIRDEFLTLVEETEDSDSDLRSEISRSETADSQSDDDDEGEGEGEGEERGEEQDSDENEEEEPSDHSRLRKKISKKEYFSSVYHSTASSLVLFDLANQLNRPTKSQLWLAIVGFTDQALHLQMDQARQYLEYESLLAAVDAFNLSSQSPSQGYTPECRIEPSTEYKLMCYRHWTLYDSLFHSSFVASRLGIWSSSKGRRRLDLFLAKMGFSLSQCKQPFQMMDLRLKRELNLKLLRYAPQFGLKEIFTDSFVKTEGGSHPLSAVDAVFSLLGLLENADGVDMSGKARDFDQVKKQNFWDAYDSLSSSSLSHKLVVNGIEKAKLQQQAIVKVGANLIEMKRICMMGSFRYGLLDCSSVVSKVFARAYALLRLSHFLQEAFEQMKKKQLPLVLCALNEATNSYTVCGVSSKQGESNIFGVKFEKAAEETGAQIKHHTFEASIVELQKEDAKRFIEHLHSSTFLSD